MSSPLYNSVRERLLARHRLHMDDVDTQLDKSLVDAHVICSTNVTQYYFAGTDQEFWHLDQHFPNLAPPFDSFWIETKAPTHINSKVYGQQPWDFGESPAYARPPRWGAWFLNANLPIDTVPDDVRELFELANFKDPAHYWMFCVMLFTQQEGSDAFPVWSFVFMIDKQTGELLKNPLSYMPDPFPWAGGPLGSFRRTIEDLQDRHVPDLPIKLTSGKEVLLNASEIFEMEAMSLLKPLMLAISFLHCRNVKRVPNYPSPQLNKKRMSRNLPPMHKFYTLEIEPMKEIIRQAVASYRGLRGASGIEMALHSVKGHFKNYGADKPLMGHHVGTWFWAGMTRGSRKRGSVKKHYEVKL